MVSQLLSTKLFIPPLRSEIVFRPTLVKRLDEGLSRKVTLISAPAGFGKTTLLSEWASTRANKITWVSLEKEDNESRQFWTYFIAGMHKLNDEIGESALTKLQSPQSLQTNEIITTLINEITEVDPEPFAIVLDDYHVIETPEIQKGIAYFIEHCPRNLHILIATRSDPQLPLGKWRARGELSEIRTNDLRFSIAETIDLFNEILGLKLQKEKIEVLERRAEGWIAGLQMIAISIQGIQRSYGIEKVIEFIDAFTGSNRYILDYLLDEVINQQDREIRDFLIKSSILDRFTASLCDAVTGYDNSREIIGYLDRTNLFLVPLDSNRLWYRYHHLFVDLLRNLLLQESPERVSILRGKACEWFEKHGFLAEAVENALSMRDTERFARLIAGNALYLIYLGELKTLERWLGELPEHTMCASPWLCIAQAWVKVYVGEYDEAEYLLHAAKQTIDPWLVINEFDETHALEVSAHITLIQSIRSYFNGNIELAIHQIQNAIQHLPEENHVIRCYASGLLGGMHREIGNLDDAEKLIEESVRIGRKTNLIPIIGDALTDLASLRIVQGRFKEAAEIGHEALKLDDEYAQLYGKHLLNLGKIHFHLGNVYLNWNEVDTALKHANKSVDIAEKWGKVDDIALCYSGLAWLHHARGEIDEALKAARKVKQIARSISPRFESLGILVEARFQLRFGNIEEAVRLSQKCASYFDLPVDFMNFSDNLFLTRLLLAQEKYSQANELLDELGKVTQSIHSIGYLVPLLVTRSLSYLITNQPNQAHAALENAMKIAAPEDWLSVFLFNEPELLTFIHEGHWSGVPDGFMKKLLTAVEKNLTKAGEEERRIRHPVELLSDRELEILKMLMTPDTHAEIAEKLYISRNTVRTHIKRIYSKLNVNKRIQAIARAKELDLI